MQKQKTKRLTRALLRLGSLLRIRKDSIEKPKEEKVWFRRIEGGILVRISESKEHGPFKIPSVRVFVLGDMAVPTVNETIYEARQATAYLRARTGRADWVLDGEADGKMLFFVFRPLTLEESIALSQKYDEMLNVTAAWKKSTDSFGMFDVKSFPITPLEKVLGWIDDSKPLNNDPSCPRTVQVYEDYPLPGSQLHSSIFNRDKR